MRCLSKYSVYSIPVGRSLDLRPGNRNYLASIKLNFEQMARIRLQFAALDSFDGL